MLKKSLPIVALLLSALAIAGCGGTEETGLSGEPVTIDVNVIEIKGATDGIKPPSVDPASLSSGYKFSAPGDYDAENPDKW